MPESLESRFEIVTTKMGALSILCKDVGEILHNPIGPWTEANLLYIDQSRLREKLVSGDSTEELVVFDVGLGAAINAVATLAAYRSTKGPKKPLKLVSFEIDLGLLDFAIKYSERFDFFGGFEHILRTLRLKKEWQEEGFSWTLLEGDFLETIETVHAKPHLIWFEPYSSEKNEEMWALECFKKIRSQCRSGREGDTALFTYSRATGIRAALIASGFFIGRGVALGAKTETTVAATRMLELENPLGLEWLLRWRRSHLKFPVECGIQSQANIEQTVEQYFQDLCRVEGLMTTP